MWLRKKRKKKTRLKSLIRFYSANNIDNYNREVKKKEKQTKKNPKEYTEQVKT